MDTTVPAVRFTAVNKQFGSFYANRDITFDVQRQSVHAVIGENGAGKSTIMKILFGFYRADSGQVEVFGRSVRPKDPTDAITLGIGMVHQHFMLIPNMTVAENIVLGFETVSKTGMLELKKTAELIRSFSEKYNMPIDPYESVENLSVGQKQRVEIIKALYRGAEILILDEPTAVLTPNEVSDFFEVLKRLKAEGKTIILITHKLNEVMAVSDRITVMRTGKIVGETDTKDTSSEALARMMVGRDVLLEIPEKSEPHERRVLEISGLSASMLTDYALKNISLHIREGEILGIAGVSGNGQTTLEEVINGSITPTAGRITLNGEDISTLSVRERKEHKIVHVPSDREKHGFIGRFSNRENLYVGYHFMDFFSDSNGFLRKKNIEDFAKTAMKTFDVRPPIPNALTGGLSGGNKQKLILAREFSHDPAFLIVAEPTRGVDIGAIEYIRKYLIKLKSEGKAIILISSDLDEICALSDRACVIYKGQITGYFDPNHMNPEQVGLLMSGGKAA